MIHINQKIKIKKPSMLTFFPTSLDLWNFFYKLKDSYSIFVFQFQVWCSLHLDYIFALFSLLYICVYVWGKKRNQDLVYQSVKSNYYPFLITQFYEIGDGHHHLLQYSASEYVLYATGHQQCQHFSIVFNCLPRQDLMSLLYKCWTSTDQVEFFIHFNTALNLNPSDFELSIVHQTYFTFAQRLTLNLTLSTLVQTAYLPSTHKLYTNAFNLVPNFFGSDPRVHRYFCHSTIAPSLYLFHWTPSSLYVKCDFQIGPSMSSFLCWFLTYVHSLVQQSKVK